MPSSRKRLSVALLVGVVLIAGILVWQNLTGVTDDRPDQTDAAARPKLPELPEPARLTSRFLNTEATVKYVGNDACTECHSEQHASYLLTGHSQALRKTDLALEPPDTEYYHKASKRWYKVYRAGDELRHREFVRDAEGRELVLHDVAVPWVMGSGNFSQSYLVEEDAFLIESPITWYSARKAWEMSPGFDTIHHPGFERLAPQGCIVCHAGAVNSRANNEFQPEILQMSIGCENCHGPGSLHVEKHRNPLPQTPTGEDLTIVNPEKLSRELADSVCASCHLRGEATVFRRGYGLNDFRPGFLLTDLRIDFGIRSFSGVMKVVGHVEQMRDSLCYSRSETLTCITCHDPHLQPAAGDRIAFFRNSCVQCHTEQACGVEQAERLRNDPADNCMACHMPKTDTDIPHFAFTHHRIGIYPDQIPPTQTASAGIDTLIPLIEPVEISDKERERALGLAYFEFAPKQPEFYPAYLQLSRRHLLRGDLDGESAAALAGISLELEFSDANSWAVLALSDEHLVSRAKLNALVVRSIGNLRSGKLESAVDDLRELVQINRIADYWDLLAEALLRSNRIEEAILAQEEAVEIAPGRIEFRQKLIDLYLKQQRYADADTQRRAIDILQRPRK